MKYRTILVAAALMLITGFAVQAADVAGKWIAQTETKKGQTRETTFTFKNDGEKLTGTVSTGRRADPISDGKVNGDEISFTVTTNTKGNEAKMNYRGKVSGDEIRFTRTQDGAKGKPQTLVAKRAK